MAQELPKPGDMVSPDHRRECVELALRLRDCADLSQLIEAAKAIHDYIYGQKPRD